MSHVYGTPPNRSDAPLSALLTSPYTVGNAALGVPSP